MRVPNSDEIVKLFYACKNNSRHRVLPNRGNNRRSLTSPRLRKPVGNHCPGRHAQLLPPRVPSRLALFCFAVVFCQRQCGTSALRCRHPSCVVNRQAFAQTGLHKRRNRATRFPCRPPFRFAGFAAQGTRQVGQDPNELRRQQRFPPGYRTIPGKEQHPTAEMHNLFAIAIRTTVIFWITAASEFKIFLFFCIASVSMQSLAQWFLTFFTYLTLLSNYITRFTTKTLNDAHFLKIWNWPTLAFRMVYKNLHFLQYMVQ